MGGSWFLYIIEAENGSLYTGITNDLLKRFEAHRRGQGARFFRMSSPREVVHLEIFGSKSEALKREIAVKKLSREEKMALVSSQDWGD